METPVTSPNEHDVAPNPQQVVVTVKNLKKSFGDRKVLQGISLELHESENLVILGRSGTGKSVLIKCMVGLIQPDDGELNVLGYDVRSLTADQLNEMRLKIGFSFQSSALYDSMSVRENLEFPLKRNLRIFDQQELNDRVVRALKEVGLEDSIDLYPSELSGGMQKRIGVARTLILNPKIVLYDEPTAGLDPVTSAEINNLILDVRKKYKTSAIIITHDISCARETSDRIIALIDGRNKVEGTFEELKKMHDPDLDPFFRYNEIQP
jgi:phospholipid/cholesterol/gamma-HCH transport system ATP-binding protein